MDIGKVNINLVKICRSLGIRLATIFLYPYTSISKLLYILILIASIKKRPLRYQDTKSETFYLCGFATLWQKILPIDLKRTAIPLISLLPYFLLPSTANAQAVHARLGFMTDSIVLGKSMELQMELMHPSHIEVMFPQKRDFAPFDLVKRQTLDSEVSGNIVTEIVSFQVRSFEIAPKQALRLPYGFVRGNDTLEAFISTDSLPFAARITSLDSTYQFKPHQGIFPLSDPPNYGRIAVILLGILGVLAILFQLLRKPINKWLKLQKLKKEWKALQQQLNDLQQESPEQAELLDKLNHIWKTYADPGGTHALKSLTASELKEALPTLDYISSSRQSFLLNLIQKSDQVIYAGQAIPANELQNFLEQCKSLLEELYQYHRRMVVG